VTFFNDAALVEYGLLLALIAVVCLGDVYRIQPGLGDQACAIRTQLESGLAALGFQNPPNPCNRGGIVP
jgi:Flp pilus assembly pilin Flp